MEPVNKDANNTSHVKHMMRLYEHRIYVFRYIRGYTGIIPHNDEGGERCFEHHEPHTTPGSFQGEVTIAWLVSLQSCQALDRPKVWTVHKQNF